MGKREDRQSAIRNIVRSNRIRTQRDLAEILQKETGLSCTQATISRDITEMGLDKSSDGSYVLPEDLVLKNMFTSMVTHVERAQNLIVIRTIAGTANGVAAAIDSVDLSEIIGTIAGDDTILLVCRSDEGAQVTLENMEVLKG